MASVMQRIFGAAKPPETMAVQNPGANPGNVAGQQSGTAANAPAVASTPLDDFKDLWQSPTTNPNDDPFSKPLLTNDPTKLAEAVGKMNFTEGLDPALVAKALQGDAAAFSQAINATVQKAFAASAQLTTQMVETGVASNNARVNQVLPKRFKEFTVNSTRSENEILNHAAAAPILDMAKRSIMAKDPSLSPQQVQKRAEEYVTSFGNSLQGQAAAKEANAPDPYDFSTLG